MKLALVGLLVLVATPLRAQSDSASSVLAGAVRAYEDLDFDRAARLLRQVLAPPLAAQLDDARRARALTYLGAAEHYRGSPDSAIAVFRRLVALAPTQRPDTLIFPPEITRLYDGVRSAATVVAVSRDTVAHPLPAPPPPPAPAPRSTVESPKRVAAPAAPITATVSGLVSNIRTGSGASTAAGFVGSVRFRRLELAVRYAEGSRDLVEGALALRVLATPWLSMQLGPHVRRYDTPFGAERWVTWRLGARGDVAIAGPSVRGYAMLWRALGLDVNLPAGSGSASGGEIGVSTALGPRPVWLSIAYGLDRARVPAANRHETVNTLTLMVGLSPR